jgi:hypothetical protein
MKSKSLKAALKKFNAVKEEKSSDFEVLNQREVDLLRGGTCTCNNSSTYNSNCTCNNGSQYNSLIGAGF